MRKIYMVALVSLLSLNSVYGAKSDVQEEEALAKVEYLMEMGELRKAMKTLDQALDDNPSSAELMAMRAGLWMVLDKRKDAIKDARAAFSLDPTSCRSNRTMAEICLLEEELDSALWYIDLAVKYIPDDFEKETVLGIKGNIHLKRNELFDAETSLIDASMCPEVSLNTMKDLATVLNLRGREEEAILILKETITMFGKDMESYVNTGYICNQIGFYDEAISFLGEALDIEKEDPIALSNMAYSQFMIGQTDQALKTVNHSLDNDNTSAYAYMVKGRVLLKMNENERACKEFKKSVHMGYGVLYDKNEITNLIIEACGTD